MLQSSQFSLSEYSASSIFHAYVHFQPLYTNLIHTHAIYWNANKATKSISAITKINFTMTLFPVIPSILIIFKMF